ncbi:hypothetical protein [Nitriliruptor alkaliphilus]|uniref:hypothetical protein n=1 Tax=Nitriliruptor alkaliphilus TaxID=427918 RepID=UPI000698026B|nr:hypothetical protein [Nitriliruptor alkaliphilus]
MNPSAASHATDTTGDARRPPRTPPEVWTRSWFGPGSAHTLLAVRVLVLATVAVDVWRNRLHYLTQPDRGGRVWEPVSVLGVLDVPPPTEAVVVACTWLALIGCVVAAGPWRGPARVAAVTALATYGTLLLTENSFGKISHSHQPLLIALVVVALAPYPRGVEAPDWRWRWPVQACRAGLAVMLLAAAWSKATTGGVAWVVGENMRNILVAEVFLFNDPALGGLSLWIASEPWRWQAVAFGALASEAVLVGALVVRRQPWRGLLVVVGISPLVAITLLMGLIGFPLVVLAALMLDVDGLARAWRTERRWWATAAAAGGLLVLAATTWLAAERLVLLLPLALFAGAVVVAVRRTHPPTAVSAADRVTEDEPV